MNNHELVGTRWKSKYSGIIYKITAVTGSGKNEYVHYAKEDDVFHGASHLTSVFMQDCERLPNA